MLLQLLPNIGELLRLPLHKSITWQGKFTQNIILVCVAKRCFTSDECPIAQPMRHPVIQKLFPALATVIVLSCCQVSNIRDIIVSTLATSTHMPGSVAIL
jgi:hypothetical protein